MKGSELTQEEVISDSRQVPRITLWALPDIADELEVHVTTVRRWVRLGQYLAPPAAVTRGGIRFWTDDQVKNACRKYHERPRIGGRSNGRDS